MRGPPACEFTETDTYIVGQESYRTDVTVTNNSVTAQAVVIYRAGDCFLQESDEGFGAVGAAGGSVSCVGVMIVDGNSVPSSRIEQWRPLTPGSSYLEAGFSEVWAAIATGQPFPNTCRCDELIDNGAGLSWSATIPAGGSATFSHLTLFSPEGNQPLNTSKTADAAEVRPGDPNGYTITVSNPNASPVTLSSVSDTLPAGFTYTPGSTTGATTADPSVAGQTLTWAGPFAVPASGTVTLHFAVTASTTLGTYFNNAGADAVEFAVVATGDTAAVTVTNTPTTTTTTSTTPPTTTTTTPGTTTTTPGTTTTTTTATTTTTIGPGGATTTTTAGGATTTTAPTSTGTTAPVSATTTTRVVTGPLARTGIGGMQLSALVAFMGVVLGSLLRMGSRGLARETLGPVPSLLPWASSDSAGCRRRSRYETTVVDRWGPVEIAHAVGAGFVTLAVGCLKVLAPRRRRPR